MNRLKGYWSFVVTGCCFAFFLAACGTSHEQQKVVEVTSDSSSSSSAPSSPDLTPDIHTNVPPPAPAKNNQDNQDSAKNFFTNKEAFDKFSPELKDRVQTSYNVDPGVDLGGNGNGYFNTLMGRTSPMMLTSADTSGGIPGIGCDPKSTFLCLDSPTADFETIDAGIDVTGNIDLTQLAVFGANDPVAVVSVFNQTGGGAASEILVMPGDVKATSDPNIGHFTAAAGLSGAGKFIIVVSAYKISGDGVGNELFSVMVQGTRDEAPKIEFVEARPEYNKLAPTGKEKDPVGMNAVIATEILDLKVKLDTAGGEGIQTKFENYDEKDDFRSASAALPVADGADNFITGKVLMHQGLNKIKVISRSPAIDAALGAAAPPPSEVDFQVFNVDGGPKLKLLAPKSDGLVIPQVSGDGQTVPLQFCYTFIPSKTEGNAGGASAPPVPTIGDTCQAGTLGFTPEVDVNGTKLTGPQAFSYDATTGIFSVEIPPAFGVNVYQILATDSFGSSDLQKSSSTVSGAFVFGNPMNLLKDGQIATSDTFTKRGSNIDVDRSLLEGDVKKILVKFLENQDTVKTALLSVFKKTASTPGYVCHETDVQVNNTGDTTINFLPDTFDLGKIDLTSFGVSGDGMLHVGVRIHGMHGDADLKGVDGRTVTYYGEDIGFVPLKLSIAQLDINLGVAFEKNSDGVLQLDLRRIDGTKVVDVIGDGDNGNFVSVDVSRNPHAAGAAFLDSQQGLVKRQFNTSIEATLLCGIEDGVNNANSGALGKTVADLEKLTGYNSNIFRIPLNFSLLGKNISLDIAYDVLKGDIKFDAQGLHITDIPLRFNPGPVDLTNISKDATVFKTNDGIVGAVARWVKNDEQPPAKSPTTPLQNAGIELSEDAVNQALAAANLDGLIDLNVDANFYTNLGITPIEKLSSNGNSLAPNVDMNLDGKVDELDQVGPVLLEVRTDKHTSPMLTFLSKDEVKALATAEGIAEKPSMATPVPVPTGGPIAMQAPFFTTGGTYFRLALANVTLTAYREQSVPDELGGSRTYCKRQWADDPSIADKGFCQLNGDALIGGFDADGTDNPFKTPTCTGGTLVTLPRLNGDKITYGPDPTNKNYTDIVPLYRIKLSLIAHGKFAGVDREVSAKEKIINQEKGISTPPATKTIMHIQIAPKDSAPAAMVLSMEMLENNTGTSDASLMGNFDTLITGAFGARCQNLNEIRIPITDKIASTVVQPGHTTPDPLIASLGVDSISLSDVDQSAFPNAFIDDDHLYLDVLLFVGLNFTPDGQ